jgi:hypothetical protein
MHTKWTCLIIFVSKQKHFIIFTAKNCIRENYFCACMNSRSILHTDFCATMQLKVHAHVHMQLSFLTRLSYRFYRALSLYIYTNVKYYSYQGLTPCCIIRHVALFIAIHESYSQFGEVVKVTRVMVCFPCTPCHVDVPANEGYLTLLDERCVLRPEGQILCWKKWRA